MNPTQKTTETKTVERQPDLLDQIIESTRDVGISLSPRGLEVDTFTGLCTLSKLIFDSGACPKSMDSSKKVLIAIAQGRSVGLDPFQSMQAFYIVNGQATLWGNAPLAICRQHPGWQEEGFDEWFEVKGERIAGHPHKWDDDTITAVCETKRGKAFAKQSRFSVADAKKAGLWGASGKLYGTYPFRMLKFRARGYALNDNFGDALKGIAIRETFDEEVDGKRENGATVEEFKKRLDEAKTDGVKSRHDKKEKTVPSMVTPIDVQEFIPQNWINPAEESLSDLDKARAWIRTVYERIPLRMNPIETLKSASMEDGTWISLEHVDSVSDLEYLNRIAARLEDSLSQAAKAKTS